MNVNRRTKYTINIIAYATLIISSFWGLYFMAPGIAKALFSLCIWMGIFIFPYKLVKNNDFTRTTNFILIYIIFTDIIQILRSVFSTDEYLYIIGNKWTTLFGNEYTALLLLPPIFTYLGTLKYSVIHLKNTTYIYMILGLIFSVYLKYPLSILTIFLVVFYPYVSKKYKLLIIISGLETFLCAVVGDNPPRMYFIVIAFTICCYILIYVIKKDLLTKLFVIIVTISPIVLFLPMLNASNNEETIFQKIQTMLTDRNDNEFAADTRTFLYTEMATDLTKTESWLIGKGASGHYYSYFFDNSKLGKYGRISSEVPFLTFLLKGGMMYVFAYFGLLLYAIYLGIWKGKNKFVKSIGIIASGWYFNCFVGDIVGCRFYHLAFFALLGCCLSHKWLNSTDEDIKLILKQK